MKGIKYYVLYDCEDRPILYFETLKEFAEKLSYNLKNLQHRFCTEGNNISLLIDRKKFKLYRFVD